MSGRHETTKLRLYPEPGELADKGGIYDDLVLPDPISRLFPYVLINMVSSVDGRSSAGGKASGIGGQADRDAMRALRSHVDAVMVGAGTLRAEKLNLGLDGTEVAQPLAVVVGGAGGLPVLEHLVRPAGQGVILALPQEPVAEKHAADAEAEAKEGVETLRCPGRQPDRVDIRRLLRVLKAEHAVDRLLVEGGPGLNRSLIDAGLVDEIFLTVAPKLLLGPEAAVISGNLDTGGQGPQRNHLTLLSVHSADDELFLRYRLGYP